MNSSLLLFALLVSGNALASTAPTVPAELAPAKRLAVCQEMQSKADLTIGEKIVLKSSFCAAYDFAKVDVCEAKTNFEKIPDSALSNVGKVAKFALSQSCKES